MYPINAATPPRIALGAVVQIVDGVVQSTGVSVVVRPEGGAETAGVGTITYGGTTNIVYYAPTQAETNYTAFTVAAYKTGCVPIAQTIITSADSVAGKVSLGSAQTSNITGNLTGSVGSVTSGVTVATGGIPSGAHSSAELNNIADSLLDRNMATGVDSGTNSTAVRTPRQALRALRNKVSVAAGVATITKEDDVTSSWSSAIVTTAGNPISSSDPT